MNNDVCPCGSECAYLDCCGPFLQGSALPGSAEKLMRSRYVAYVTQQSDYILNTWHNDTRPEQISLDRDMRWLGLKIKSVKKGQFGDDEGIVEFVARYKLVGRGFRLHEVSRFVFEQGRWFYVGAVNPQGNDQTIKKN